MTEIFGLIVRHLNSIAAPTCDPRNAAERRGGHAAISDDFSGGMSKSAGI
jgi:hypothetical protein